MRYPTSISKTDPLTWSKVLKGKKLTFTNILNVFVLQSGNVGTTLYVPPPYMWSGISDLFIFSLHWGKAPKCPAIINTVDPCCNGILQKWFDSTRGQFLSPNKTHIHFNSLVPSITWEETISLSSFSPEMGFYHLHHPSLRTLSRLGIFARTTVTLASPSGGDNVPLPYIWTTFPAGWTSSDAHDIDRCSFFFMTIPSVRKMNVTLTAWRRFCGWDRALPLLWRT